jgi:hypothetical protein
VAFKYERTVKLVNRNIEVRHQLGADAEGSWSIKELDFGKGNIRAKRVFDKGTQL